MRIKRTEELHDTYYPNHMLWVPLQDVRKHIEKTRKVLETRNRLYQEEGDRTKEIALLKELERQFT